MQTALEAKFPRIVVNLASVWDDSGKAAAYLEDLLFKESSRDERHGFDGEVWAELMFLDSLLTQGKLTYNPLSDVWSQGHDTARR